VINVWTYSSTISWTMEYTLAITFQVLRHSWTLT